MNIVEVIDDPNLLGPAFEGPSWDPWRVILKAAFALPMNADELALFRTLAERDPPPARVRELWVISGRRAGKDSVASAIVTYFAAFADYTAHLRPGEQALCMCLAVDKTQADIVQRYARGYFLENEMLRAMVTREAPGGLELDNGAEIAVHTNSFRSVRGRTIACAVLDEVAYWRDENSASPDKETYRAITPGLATLPGSMLVGISTPYKRSGLLFEKWRRHFGQDSEDILVIHAPSISLNATIDQRIIDRDLEEDPEKYSAEWLAQWRTDVNDFIDRATVDAVTVPGRIELPPVGGVSYHAFCDPSGGSADSFTLAIGHRAQDGTGVLDLVRERRPPFSPDAVVQEFAELLKGYGIGRLRSDRYGGQWVVERFLVHGLTVEPAPQAKSEIYREFLPLANSRRVELLDIARLSAQLCGLERRTIRGGRESIDHYFGGHDDVANAAAGVLTEVAGKVSRGELLSRFLE